jgi:hypothetical protein
MDWLKKLHFWQLMVGTGFFLLILGLVMIFLPPGIGDHGPFEIWFFEARIESSEMGLALIVLGLSCFLIGRKDLADLRVTNGLRDELDQTSSVAARLVAGQVDKAFRELPARPTSLASLPDLDLDLTWRSLQDVGNQDGETQAPSFLLEQAQRGLDLLKALEREGYVI